jgi:hypothetical protein
MKFSVSKYILSDYAKRLAEAAQQIEKRAQEQLDALSEDDTRTDEYKQSERDRIFQEAADGYREAAKATADDAKFYADQFRRLAKAVPTPEPSPAAAQALSLLSIAPVVTQPMIERASDVCKEDYTAMEILAQIANNAGISFIPPQMKERHLTGDQIARMAEYIENAHSSFWDCRRGYIDPDPRSVNTLLTNEERREETLTRAHRSNSAAMLRELPDTVFDFGSDTMNADFASISESAEI